MEYIKMFFVKHLLLKILSFILALLVWFYIVNELNKGSLEEMKLLKKALRQSVEKEPEQEFKHGKVRR